MARGKKKESALTPEEKLAQALVPDWEQPYKVPGNWCWVKLAQLCSIPITDGTHKTPTYSDRENGSPFVSAKDITSEYIDWTNIKYITKELHTELYERLAPQKNDVLLAKNGTTGIAALVEDDRVFDLYVTIAVLRPNMGIIIPQYLLRVINSPVSKNQFDEHLIGIGVPNLHLRDIKATAIPLPPFSEQQRIVDRIEYLFAKLDEAKEKAQSVLDSFETRKAAILHKAFTGELTTKWRAEHGGQGWSIVTLGDVCRFENGYAFKSDKFSDVEGTPVVRISNISEMGVDVDGCILTTEVNIDKRFQVQYGDLLIAMSGATTGKNGVYISDKIAFLNQRVGNIKIKDPSQLVPGYRNYYILHMRETILQNAYGGAQPNISSGKICAMEFPLSPFEEQQEIVRILDSLFAKEQQAKEAAEAVLDKIDLLKKSILARAFRGELGTNDPSEESALELLKTIL